MGLMHENGRGKLALAKRAAFTSKPVNNVFFKGLNGVEKGLKTILLLKDQAKRETGPAAFEECKTILKMMAFSLKRKLLTIRIRFLPKC